MVLLDQGVVPFAQNLARLVADDDAPDGRPALRISFFCQQKRDAHKVAVCQFPEKPVLDNSRKAFGRKMSDGIQDLIAYGGVLGNKRIHKGSFRGFVQRHLAQQKFILQEEIKKEKSAWRAGLRRALDATAILM
jgi:hypothetical protein